MPGNCNPELKNRILASVSETQIKRIDTVGGSGFLSGMRATTRINKASQPEVPSPHNWRTTDQEEILRRRERARTEEFRISNLDARHPIFSNFRVHSGSGLVYSVEIRDVAQRQFACDCVDFRINGLGTCKHVEAVLLYLEARLKGVFKEAAKSRSPRWDVVPDSNRETLRLNGPDGPPSAPLAEWFGADGLLISEDFDEAIAALRAMVVDIPELRVSQEVGLWLENRLRVAERTESRREYELKAQSGEWPTHETLVPLFPYQREGMLHLAFTERALLADEMGLGKTIQAIAACALLHRMGKAARVLVVTPASLKTEWEEQIQRFTKLEYQLVFGGRFQRLKAYEAPPFFTIVNYEQMLADSLEVNARLQPDIVILDEAQRIKNWSTKTTQAIKRLRSRYAFVLTGTPVENRIDELYSLMDFLNPSILGPLFRFNREYYVLDDRGRPTDYQNLDKLHQRISPYMLRRRKADVETELPARLERNFFVQLSDEQAGDYEGFSAVVARLVAISKRRSLSKPEQDKLLRYLGMMRMVCDTSYILNSSMRKCPKLDELEKILDECRENPEVKVIIFSEWERMLELVRELCRKMEIGFAWHTGTVPQKRRRAEINAFKSDSNCRVFLSTDSGATGLNLQVASVVINCDLPWNPAKLEQRIARAWRKHQTRAVNVINLVSENTIEHKMLGTLSNKQALADGVLDLKGDLKAIKLKGGGQAFLSKLDQILTPLVRVPTQAPPVKPPLPADRSLGFAQAASQQINGALVRCEERYPDNGPHSVLYVVVDRDAAQWREKLSALHTEYFAPGSVDPLAPVQLEVIDRATDEALKRLIESGLISRTTRACRPLWPADSTSATPSPLSATELQQAAAHRQLARRKLKMARLLCDTEFADESRAAVRDALLPLARAIAVENRLPEPASLNQITMAPLTLAWKDALPTVRQFMQEATGDMGQVVEALERI